MGVSGLEPSETNGGHTIATLCPYFERRPSNPSSTTFFCMMPLRFVISDTETLERSDDNRVLLD